MKPILFSTEMVQAILDGRKTQTRRIVKPQPTSEWMNNTKLFSASGEQFDHKGKQLFWIENPNNGKEVKCPYGKPGDILWVREMWKWIGDTSWKDIDPIGSFWYKADEGRIWEDGPSGWKPSIHMPFIACRLFLKIKSIKVERLQEIPENDAVSEGIEWEIMGEKYGHLKGERMFKDYSNPTQLDFGPTCAKDSFKYLWQSINGEESWNENPWVWVIKFQVTLKPNH